MKRNVIRALRRWLEQQIEFWSWTTDAPQAPQEFVFALLALPRRRRLEREVRAMERRLGVEKEATK